MPLLAVLLVLLFPWSSRAAELFGQQVFASGVVECNVPRPNGEWINPHPYPIRIHKVRVWVGLDKGKAADIGVVVVRARDNNMLMKYTHDRYFDPNGVLAEVMEFGDLGPVLQPGERLVFIHRCERVFSQPPVHANFGVDAWWIREAQ